MNENQLIRFVTLKLEVALTEMLRLFILLFIESLHGLFSL